MRYCSQVEAFDIPSNKFLPLSDQMLVSYIMEEESKGGILYGSKQDTWQADVVCVGPNCTISAGSRILLEEYRGDNIDLSDGKFTVVSEKNVLAEIS